MITEDYVSFKTAKLLKEKGFDEYCKSIYHVGSLCSVTSLGYHDNEGYGAIIDKKQNSDFGKYDNAISAPTLQMAMKWLRENHKIHIQIWILEENGYWFDIEKILNDQYKHKSLYSTGLEEIYFETYEQACEAAIKYCLENLI